MTHSYFLCRHMGWHGWAYPVHFSVLKLRLKRQKEAVKENKGRDPAQLFSSIS